MKISESLLLLPISAFSAWAEKYTNAVRPGNANNSYADGNGKIYEQYLNGFNS